MSLWEGASPWYTEIVGEKGHHYHQAVVLPRTLALLQLSQGSSCLDIGCGQGVLSRSLPKGVRYVGLDASKALIREAKRLGGGEFFVGDASHSYPFEDTGFDAACFLLSLQNIERGEAAVLRAVERLKVGGRLLLVLNHPCFRIPRQSEWGVDAARQLQYRKIFRYLSPEVIPIQTHPGRKKDSPHTLSYHFPLSHYVALLSRAVCPLTTLEEWCSDKQSAGKHAKREDRARREIPLFAALLGVKRPDMGHR